MNQESLIQRLQQIEVQGALLDNERRRIISILAEGVSTPSKKGTLSAEQRAALFNKRDRTLLKRNYESSTTGGGRVDETRALAGKTLKP